MQGRFTSADSWAGRMFNPQTLNLYSYVRNNPLKFVDPTGHQDEDPKRKRGKKGENDPEICPDCIVVVNINDAEQQKQNQPGPVPQPAPTPTPAPPTPPASTNAPWIRFMTKEELREERAMYARSGPKALAIYDFWHSPLPALLALPGGLAEEPEESAITTEVLDETGVEAGSTESATILESNAGHIFRDAPGHMTDTPISRQLLIETTSNQRNLLGMDKFGNQWFARTLPNGQQIWASVRGNIIRNGGLNESPRGFNANTGLSR
jgi:hypothetical protein